ncbi:MAG: hypothetical protein J5582_01005 [Ruminococcus sp.]|uniref:hypothetical protein n=1 Tax=Ruminococcus sp. TaxID=41978 RepID=UPI0025F18DF4|nr:hypothetical protein [Ruminococcus sp.]MBO4865135.1 hypothetical protein [Ruminococcus sp.]
MENTRKVMVISALVTIVMFLIAVINYSHTDVFDPALGTMIAFGTGIYCCASQKYKEEIEEADKEEATLQNCNAV